MDFDVQPFVLHDFLSSDKAPVTRNNSTVDFGDQENSVSLALSLSCHTSSTDEEKGDNGGYKKSPDHQVLKKEGMMKSQGLSLDVEQCNISMELTVGGVYSSGASKGKNNVVTDKGKKPVEEHDKSKSKVGGDGISLELSLGFNNETTVTTTKRKMSSISTSSSVHSRACTSKTSKAENNERRKTSNYPWVMKKKLTKSDLGGFSRLLLEREWVEDHVIPFWSADQLARIKEGLPVTMWDCDTNTTHNLVYKQWTHGANVLMTRWIKDFVKRRGLNVDDEIALYWDQQASLFKFSLLNRAPARRD